MIDDLEDLLNQKDVIVKEENEPLSTNKSHDVKKLEKKKKDNGKLMTNIAEPTTVEDIETRYSSIKKENETLPKMDSPLNKVNVESYDEQAGAELGQAQLWLGSRCYNS